MSKKKALTKSTWGGRRAGSGKPGREGGTEKICVSVTKDVWQSALAIWNGKASRLVDSLLRDYVGSVKQETEAV